MASQVMGYYENHRDDMAHASGWYAKNDHAAPHFHNSIELVYVLEGVLKATLDGEVNFVPAGTLLINSSYTIHCYETPESSYSIIAIIPMKEVPQIRQALSSQAFAETQLRDDDRRTFETLMRLMAELSQGHEAALTGVCGAVLGLLIDRVGLVEAHQTARTAFIRDVLDYLEQHHHEPLTVKGVADHFGYSRSRFSDIFSRQLGLTLCAYINAVRCRHAAQLLKETDMPVSEVALQVGFETLRTFYRAFKTQYDMTPNRYAKG